MPMRDGMSVPVKTALLGVMLAAAFPAQAQDAMPPFRWTDVGLTSDCGPNPGFLRVLRYLDGRHPDPDAASPPVDGPVAHALAGAGDTEQRLTLDTPQAWHGLKLSGLGVMSGIERGPVAYSLYFEDGIDKVRHVLNQRGWKIPPKENGREIIENYASIGLDAEADGGTSVSCARD